MTNEFFMLRSTKTGKFLKSIQRCTYTTDYTQALTFETFQKAIYAKLLTSPTSRCSILLFSNNSLYTVESLPSHTLPVSGYMSKQLSKTEPN